LQSYALDMLRALAHIHSKGIIHADIKIDNVLTQMPEKEGDFPILKLCDFGLSLKVGPNGRVNLLQKIGTIGYMAPELGIAETIDTSIDIWSFGIVLYELSCAYKPT